ncbi:MAG TPA: hypothetical protein VN018_08460 [Brevundimonas sp.]|nr:hypothetical protein [Brevundimonas sp.]
MSTILVPALVSAVVSVAVALLASMSNRARLRREFALEFASEAAVKALLTHPDWKCRTFDMIQKRLGGFDEDELRRLLVRAGAVRAYRNSDKAELWGLASLNPELLKNEDA